MPPSWKPGYKLTHPFNPELGIGLVTKVEGRFLSVYFAKVEREITLAAQGGGLERLILHPGAPARILATDEEVCIESHDGSSYTLRDGRVVEDAEIWPLEPPDTPVERIARMRLDRIGSVRNRIDGLELLRIREAGGLGSLLGGRIELFPHQLHTALAALKQDPVRWLLADEVGLGKTVVAALVLSALVRTGRAERALVIAPDTLVVQWLGELYRKFHQVFVLLDEERIECVARDVGPQANPFDVHPYGVISFELLQRHPILTELAREVDLDLVVVDEAHRLGDSALATEVEPLVERARHALLLTATPLAADRHGFFRLLHQLHPEAFSDFARFERTIEEGTAVFPCTSAVRRDDLGSLPPRRAIAVQTGPAHRDPHRDPRARWIADHVREWLERREKALVFVHDVTTLERMKKFLESITRTHISVFHEGLSSAQRDIEVARFRETLAPVLLCSEAGTEGRNFQFCDRMIHYDLPLDPVELEQRIGRLDRIGRTKDVEIIYFRSEGAAPDVAALFERLDLFERPSAGLDPALAPVRSALQESMRCGEPLDIESIASRVEKRHVGPIRDVPRIFYRDAYDASRDAKIVDSVPEDLESRTRRFCLSAANELGMKIVEKGGTAIYYLELGSSLTVETLPGVGEDSRWIGTFDRREALEKEEMDFFACGHPLVEGLLLELADGSRGRAGICELPHEEEAGVGLFCAYRQGSGWQPVVVDGRGELRPEWASMVIDALPRARSVKPDQWKRNELWADAVRELGEVAASTGIEGTLDCAFFFKWIPAEAPLR
jgi:ATP-dependent helicase HepA